jgi:MatE
VNSPDILQFGLRFGPSGRPQLDYRAVVRLAFPFMMNSAVQAVLNATDTWFVGRLSPAATSAMGAVYWPVLVLILLLGGVSLSVQTLVAHAYGGRRYTRASQATWLALWAALIMVPAFAALAVCGRALFAPFGIPPHTLDLAIEYWFPRMLGAPLGRPSRCASPSQWRLRTRSSIKSSSSTSDSASRAPHGPQAPLSSPDCAWRSFGSLGRRCEGAIARTLPLASSCVRSYASSGSDFRWGS